MTKKTTKKVDVDNNKNNRMMRELTRFVFSSEYGAKEFINKCYQIILAYFNVEITNPSNSTGIYLKLQNVIDGPTIEPGSLPYRLIDDQVNAIVCYFVPLKNKGTRINDSLKHIYEKIIFGEE